MKPLSIRLFSLFDATAAPLFWLSLLAIALLTVSETARAYGRWVATAALVAAILWGVVIRVHETNTPD